MTSFAMATAEALLIVRQGSTWTVEQHLKGMRPESIAVDPGDPAGLYVGTSENGLYRSGDGGRSWEPTGTGIPHSAVTAVAVQQAPDSRPGIVFAGTEPSTLSRSEDGGESWRELPALLELPSSSRWSFPPKPETHHVRWIETDPNVTGRLYVAIEAGALVCSNDGGESWSRTMDGLRHRYLVGVAVDPGDAHTVIVSGAAGPSVAYRPHNAQAYVYRKSAGEPFELAMEGLPAAAGTVASRLATHPSEPHVFYAANNHGLFRSQDGGLRWEALEIAWPEGIFRGGVHALAVFMD